nr:822_t:CDS:2 [Entrophospora candida]
MSDPNNEEKITEKQVIDNQAGKISLIYTVKCRECGEEFTDKQSKDFGMGSQFYPSADYHRKLRVKLLDHKSKVHGIGDNFCSKCQTQIYDYSGQNMSDPGMEGGVHCGRCSKQMLDIQSHKTENGKYIIKHNCQMECGNEMSGIRLDGCGKTFQFNQAYVDFLFKYRKGKFYNECPNCEIKKLKMLGNHANDKEKEELKELEKLTGDKLLIEYNNNSPTETKPIDNQELQLIQSYCQAQGLTNLSLSDLQKSQNKPINIEKNPDRVLNNNVVLKKAYKVIHEQATTLLKQREALFEDNSKLREQVNTLTAELAKEKLE